jgi:hypothetical protein
MKRFNFLKYQNPAEGTAAGVSRTTTTKPVDYVGELRVTKFKLSRGTLPIMYLEPSKRAFTAEDKNTVPAHLTPSDLTFLLFCTKNLRDGSQIPNNGTSYAILNNNISGFYNRYPLETSPRTWRLGEDGNNIFWAILVTIMMPVKPQWIERNGFFYLLNDPLPIFSWDDIFNRTHVIEKHIYSPRDINNISFKFELTDNSNGTISFLLTMIGQLINTDSIISSVTLSMNATALNFFGMNFNPDARCEIAVPRGLDLPGYSEGSIITTYAPDSTFEWNGHMEQLVKNYPQTITERVPLFDMSAIITPNKQDIPRDFFPVSHLLISCDELNFKGESISVNTTAQQGVIDPSSLSILKSFFIGINDGRDISNSDFIYLDDSMTNTPVIVNSPRQIGLTIRLWVVTNKGILYPLLLPGGSSFAIQLTLS